MIVLSAGHHPQATGASYNGRIEHEEAVRWVGRIASLLAPSHVVNIVPTGTLEQKVACINRWHQQTPVSIAVEIHFNSDPQHAGRGSETLYCPGSRGGLAAAKIMQDSLGPIFPPSRGVKEGWYRMDKPGHIDYPGDTDGDEKIDYFLKTTLPVSLIVEPEFIHRATEIDSFWVVGCEVIADALKVIAQGRQP